MNNSKLTLVALKQTLAICRLEPNATVPDWAMRGGLYSVTCTEQELSIVCSEENVPNGVKCDRGWRCISIEGTLDFSLTGIMAALSTTLADASVSIFAISTFDTDHILVKADNFERAVDALRKAGNQVKM